MGYLNPISRWPYCPMCGLELVSTNPHSRAKIFRCTGFPTCSYNCEVIDDTVSNNEFPNFNEFPDLDKLAQDWGWENWEAFDESRE